MPSYNRNSRAPHRAHTWVTDNLYDTHFDTKSDGHPTGTTVYLATNRSVVTGNGSGQVLRARLAEVLPGVQVVTYPDWFGPGRSYSPQAMAVRLQSVDAVVVWPRRIRTASMARQAGRTPLVLSAAVRNHVRLARMVKRPVLVFTPSVVVLGEHCQISRHPMTDPADLVPVESAGLRWELWVPHPVPADAILATARTVRRLCGPAAQFRAAVGGAR